MAQKGETLVEVKDLCKNFGVTIALSHVDFVVKTGEIRGLIGENGSGKSTVSSIIAGMQPASSGEMFYKGKPWKPATMLEAQKAGIDEFVVISNHKFAQHGKTENHWFGCCKAVWDAIIHFSLPCGDLRKGQVVVSRHFYGNVYFFAIYAIFSQRNSDHSNFQQNCWTFSFLCDIIR